MSPRSLALAVLGLGILAGCGGGGGGGASAPAAATRLVYADPAGGAYQLRRQPALSTDSHLVLELWGPAGGSGCGVSVAFTLGGAAAWRNVGPADPARSYVRNGTVFDLGPGVPILKATVRGQRLVATVAEKGLAAPKGLDAPLLQVALDLQPGTPAGTVIPLVPDPAGCRVLTPDGALSPCAVAASSVSAQ